MPVSSSPAQEPRCREADRSTVNGLTGTKHRSSNTDKCRYPAAQTEEAPMSQQDTPIPPDDTEGHRLRQQNAAPDDDDDTEGHRLGISQASPDQLKQRDKR